MEQLQKLQDLNVAHKRVFLRADLNVPLINGTIINDFKLNAIRPTLDYLLQQKAIIILATHIGNPPSPRLRPGETKKHDVAHPEPVEGSTQHLIPWFQAHGYTIQFEPDLEKAKHRDNQKAILLLENLRFFEGEKQSSSVISQPPSYPLVLRSHAEALAKADVSKDMSASLLLARQLASLADVYVNDAFGVSHRSDTSVTLLPEQFAPEQKAIGLLMQKEIAQLSKIKKHPTQPYIMVLGGKKLNEKVSKLSSLFALRPEQQPQKILLGSAIDNEQIKDFIEQAQHAGITILLPTDFVSNAARPIDIGPDTIKTYTHEIVQAKTIFTNGTMGIYEQEASSHGTKAILQAIADSNAFTVVGGGDAVAGVYAFGLEHDIDFLSTGGGASLAFLASE